MIVSLSLIRYRRRAIPFAFLAMAIHRVPLFFNEKCRFWKLMGCGKNGTFDLNPDFQQWGLMAVWENEADFQEFYQSSFVTRWWRFFGMEQWSVLCEPLSSHGLWSGQDPFKNPANDQDYPGPVAILTRAQIRWTKLRSFWANVGNVAEMMSTAPGYLYSVGIGEAPFYLQATFSVWESLDEVKNFAYKSREHAEVIRKTRKEDWYSEELFARFKILKTIGSLGGINPLASLNLIHQEK